MVQGDRRKRGGDQAKAPSPFWLACWLVPALTHLPPFPFPPQRRRRHRNTHAKARRRGKEKREKNAFSAIRKVAGGKHGGTVPSSATLSSRDGAISSPFRNRKLKSAAKAERGGKKLFSLLPPPLLLKLPFPSPPSSLSLPCCWHYNGTREEEERGWER